MKASTNAAGAIAIALGARRRDRGRGAGARGVRRRRPAVPVPGRTRRRDLHRRLRAPARPRSTPRSRPRVEGAWRRVVVVFQPHRYTRTASIGPQFADAFTDADTLVLTDVYAAGETPIPGVSGRVILRAVLDHHPALPVAYLPRPADLDRGAAAVRARRASRADARRRRPHDHARRLARARARDDDDSDVDRARDSTRAPRAGRVERDAPVGRAHDLSLRRPARRARARRPRGRLSRRGRGAGRGRPRCRCSSSAGARTCWSPTPASRASRSCSAASSSASTSTRVAPRSRPAARPPLPVLARQAAKAGIGGLEFYVGIPGSVGGAVRMNAGGHGARDRASRRRRPGCSTCAGGGARDGRRRRARRSATARSALGPRDVVVAARFAGRDDDPDGVRAPDRRDRALAPRAPARRAERGIGVHEPARRHAPAGSSTRAG